MQGGSPRSGESLLTRDPGAVDGETTSVFVASFETLVLRRGRDRGVKNMEEEV